MSKTNKRLVGILLALAMVLSMLPMAVLAADTTTLYCAAPSGWGTCNVYWWNSSQSNPGWPGEPMTKGADGIWYYEVPSDATNVIFNNGSGTQSNDLVMPSDENVQFNFVAKTWGPYTGAVEEPEIETVTVYVEAPASWGTPNAYWWSSSLDNPGWPGYPMTAVEGNVYSYDVPADLGGLIFNGAGGQTADLTLPTGENVMYSVATASWGPFEIKEPVVVTYTYVVAGSETLCGTAWDYTNTANAMTVDGDTASISYTAVAAGDYEFKVVKVGTDGSAQWIGNGEDNVTFTVAEACDVTIKLDLTTNAISVEGLDEQPEEPPVEPPVEPVETVYYLRGDMNNWGLDHPMTNNGDGTYSVTISLVAGTYEYKAAVEDWSWVVPEGGNLTLELAEDADVTFTLNTNDYTLTNNAPVAEPEYDYYLAGSEELCGVAWDPVAQPMTEVVPGVWTIIRDVFVPGTYEYKITTGSWETPSYGYGDGNYTVNLKNASRVTITFNEETKEVTCEIFEFGQEDLKFQLNAGASADDEAVDLRLITKVESLDYSSVEFQIWVGEECVTVSCETVYEAINANGNTLTCEDIFGTEGYLVTFTLANIPTDIFDSEITVQAIYTPNENNETEFNRYGSNKRTIVLSDVLA